MADNFRHLVGKATRHTRLLFATTPWHKKALNLQYDFPGELVNDSAGVFIKPLGIHVPSNSYEFLFDAYRHLKIISVSLRGRFYFEEDAFFIEFEDKKLNITTAEEIFIIIEIFVIGSYNFFSADRLIMIDVGMNVGFASLFFASKGNIEKVYGFEPFQRTYNQAMRNLNMNPNISSKIVCFNYGLSDNTETLDLDYNYENKGQVGIHGTSLIRGQLKDGSRTQISLRKASLELTKIFDGHPEHIFGIKIDCEGSEYSIIKNLHTDCFLQKFKCILIEWHEKGPEELLDLLRTAGFAGFFQHSLEKKVGMIYAIR